MIHRRTHPEFVEGCKPCKWATVAFGTVPGGAKDARNGVGNARQRERDLHRYREKRRASEQPDGTTKEAMDRSERKMDAFARSEQSLVDNNPPDVVRQAKKALTNQT